MDAKITLSFDAEIIREAKEFAALNNISLSRLTEFIYRQITLKNYKSLDDFPISDWVNQVAEEAAEYRRTPPRENLKSDFFESQK